MGFISILAKYSMVQFINRIFIFNIQIQLGAETWTAGYCCYSALVSREFKKKYMYDVLCIYL